MAWMSRPLEAASAAAIPACELCFGRELKHIVQRARGDDGQKRKAQHGVVDIHAGVGDQRGRPAPVEGAEDLQRARDDKAGEHGESAHARGGHGVDAALGRVVHGVKLDGDLLDDGRQHIGGGESRERQTDVGKQRLHVNTAYRRYVQNLTYDSRDTMAKGGGRLDNTVIAKVRASRWGRCAMGARRSSFNFLIDRCPELFRIVTCLGDVAQLGERCRRMAEAEVRLPSSPPIDLERGSRKRSSFSFCARNRRGGLVAHARYSCSI